MKKVCIFCVLDNLKINYEYFIEYYIRLGIDHIFFYKNNKNNYLIDNKYKDNVTISSNIYNLKEIRKIYDWVLLLGIDDYLLLNKKFHNNINNYLKSVLDINNQINVIYLRIGNIKILNNNKIIKNIEPNLILKYYNIFHDAGYRSLCKLDIIKSNKDLNRFEYLKPPSVLMENIIFYDKSNISMIQFIEDYKNKIKFIKKIEELSKSFQNINNIESCTKYIDFINYDFNDITTLDKLILNNIENGYDCSFTDTIVIHYQISNLNNLFINILNNNNYNLTKLKKLIYDTITQYNVDSICNYYLLKRKDLLYLFNSIIFSKKIVLKNKTILKSILSNIANELYFIDFIELLDSDIKNIILNENKIISHLNYDDFNNNKNINKISDLINTSLENMYLDYLIEEKKLDKNNIYNFIKIIESISKNYFVKKTDKIDKVDVKEKKISKRNSNLIIPRNHKMELSKALLEKTKSNSQTKSNSPFESDFDSVIKNTIYKKKIYNIEEYNLNINFINKENIYPKKFLDKILASIYSNEFIKKSCLSQEY